MVACAATDSIDNRLWQVFTERDRYSQQRQADIVRLRLLLDGRVPAERYAINKQLADKYRKYQLDSALHYAAVCGNLAEELDSDSLMVQAQIQLAGFYSAKGQFIEAQSLLRKIHRGEIPSTLLPEYFETYRAFCSQYGQSNGDDTYYKLSEFYRDSLLDVLVPTSLSFRITEATKWLYGGQTDTAANLLHHMLDETTDRDESRALIAYLLGVIYKQKGDVERQRTYFSISATADMINAIKDNASLQSLALTYADMGRIKEAHRLMEAAIADAVFCNARYRTVEGSSFYPVINAAYQEQEAKQKATLVKYLWAISVLSVVLVVGLAYIFYQMRKLSRIRRALAGTNRQLQVLNDDLKQANVDLSEANHIKEAYIAQFFDTCSAYIDKLEAFRRSIYKRAKANQTETLLGELKSNNVIEAELADLYHNFDTIFLNLYPSFIDDFNELLVDEERITVKSGELLPNDLRIFALVRLGITDSVKIANFLRYSLRTVYNYRTKLRSKARVSREEFDERVKQIGNLHRI